MAEHERFVVEQLAAARVPQVASLIDAFLDQDSQSTVLVFPRLEPLPTKSLDLAAVIDLTRQTASILASAHAAGWIHMDVSPANLMADPAGRVVLIDWGLARQPTATPPSPGAAACGTPGYIAPELFNGVSLTTAADIYSLGVVVGQWLEIYLPGCSLNYLGSKFVRHPTTTFICRKIEERRTQQREGIHTAWPTAISAAADLLYQMLQADPEARISAAGILSHPLLNLSQDDLAQHTYAAASQLLLKRSLFGSEGDRHKHNPVIFYRGK